MKHKILCLGDSNTYGYNPRSPLGDRYPRDYRWTGILHAGPRWDIVNAGENGREIPRRDWELDRAATMLKWAKPEAVVVMLGTNDLLEGAEPQVVTERMEQLLTYLLELWPHRDKMLLICPPPMVKGLWVNRPELPDRSARLAEGYHDLARRMGLICLDAGAWNVGLTFDGVHFSKEGHMAFAAGMDQALERLFSE